jgi:hypothetical protein
VEWFKQYYLCDPHFAGGTTDPDKLAILSAPPVKRLYALYGVNLPTERFYIFKKSAPKAPTVYELDKNQNTPPHNLQGLFKVKNGWGFEVPETPQPNIKFFTGQEGRRSGDGTVTYASLNFCEYWRKEGVQVTVEEIEGAEHRAILNNRLFFRKLIEYIAEQRKEQTQSSLGLNFVSSILEDIEDNLDAVMGKK